VTEEAKAVNASLTHYGTYFYQEAVCPFCGEQTLFRHLESPYSLFTAESFCRHAYSRTHDPETGTITVFFQP
jgi:hypothetical protein